MKPVRAWLVALAVLLCLPAGSLAADHPKYVGEDAAQAYASCVTPGDDANKQFGGTCFLNEGEPLDHLKDEECLPKPGARKSAIIWGDSSMAMYARDLRADFARAGYSMGQLTSSQCPPIVGYRLNERPLCQSYNERFVRTLLRVKPSIVVMSWCHCYDFTNDALAKTLTLLEKNGSRVVILGTNPWFDYEVRLVLADRARKNDARTTIDATENKRFGQILDTEKDVKHVIATAAPDVRYVSVFSTVCPKQTCVVAKDGTPIYYDAFHVTPLGSAENTKRFFPLLLLK